MQINYLFLLGILFLFESVRFMFGDAMDFYLNSFKGSMLVYFLIPNGLFMLIGIPVNYFLLLSFLRLVEDKGDKVYNEARIRIMNKL